MIKLSVGRLKDPHFPNAQFHGILVNAVKEDIKLSVGSLKVRHCPFNRIDFEGWELLGKELQSYGP